MLLGRSQSQTVSGKARFLLEPLFYVLIFIRRILLTVAACLAVYEPPSSLLHEILVREFFLSGRYPGMYFAAERFHHLCISTPLLGFLYPFTMVRYSPFLTFFFSHISFAAMEAHNASHLTRVVCRSECRSQAYCRFL
jgi:hypothetical protein